MLSNLNNMGNKTFYISVLIVSFISLVLGTVNESVFVPIYALAIIASAFAIGTEILVAKQYKMEV